MSSCTVCVYDLYATALEDYEEALTQARSELSARSIPPEEWPTEVLTEADRKKREEEQRAIQASEGGVEAGRRIGITGESDHDRQMAVIIGAFVKFEQALKEKRKAEKARPQPTAGQHLLGSSSQPSLP
jgi:Oxidoreductase-like protein, N-terminal